MISFQEFRLSNGLQVIVHEDPKSPLVCMNLLYKVGSRNENPEKTGFAHLFEHLMFGGSKHIPNFDGPLQAVGGDNNAFTNADITNYYLTIPAENVETAFWLESDRMLSLSFDPQVLEVQRKVVIEEFKQRYLNQPYGDLWLRMRPLAYKRHPYQWPTIGKEISHIEEATMDDVRNFFGNFYGPNNAILVLAGGIRLKEAESLCEKWFGPINPLADIPNSIPKEESQTSARFLSLEADVPANALYKTYHMPGRMSERYHAVDLLSDLLGRGKTSYLYDRLVKEQQIFHSISARVTGNLDPGLFIVSGKLAENTGYEQAERAIEEVMESIKNGDFSEEHVGRIRNQAESAVVFGEMEVLNRAMALAYAAFLGDPNLVNEELQSIISVSKQDIVKEAGAVLSASNSNTIHYSKAS